MISITVDDRFDLKEDLGQGGMSRVVRVHEKHLNIEAALKLPLEDDTTNKNSFSALAKREYQLIHSIRFPGIVRLIERSTEDSEYVLMELCRGTTLDKITTPLAIPVALNVLSAISASIEYVRARGIVHGDIKPHNIFLPADFESSHKGSLFHAKLSDFAFGRFENEPDSHRLGLGTVGYMSPEIVTDSKSSHQSDLFALGVIAYQLLTGIHPYTEDSSDPLEINSRIRENVPKPVNEVRRDCPVKLSELIQQLLSISAKSRPQTAWDVCTALAGAGSEYPYKKVLRPSYFFDRDRSYHQTMQRYFDTTQAVRDQLDTLTNEDSTTARLLLTANFNRGSLVYSAAKFEFSDKIYWPSLLRRKILAAYSSLTLSEKKACIKRSLRADTVSEIKNKNTNPSSSSIDASSPALDQLLLQFLSVASVKRLSGEAAHQSESENNFAVAASQYLRAGKLSDSIRCAHIATKEMVDRHDNQEAIQLLSRVIEFAATTDRLFEVRQLLMVRGDIHKDQGDTESAHSSYNQIIRSYKNNRADKLLAETYKDLGELYRVRREFSKGLASLEKSIQIFEELDDELEISHARNNIANIYWHDEQASEALINYRMALRIQRRLSAESDTASTINNIASVFGIQGRFPRAIKLFLLALEIQRRIGHSGAIARTLNNLGYVYHVCGNVKGAIERLTESLELNRRIGSNAEILHNLENLSAVMITAGQLRTLIPYLKEGIRISNDLGYRTHLCQSQLNLVITFTRIGRLREAQSILSGIESKIIPTDNPVLRSAVILQKANLCQIVGKNEDAVKYAQAALEIAKESEDPATELTVLLFLIGIHDDKQAVCRSLAIAESLHLKREKRLIVFYQVARILEFGNNEEANKISLPTIHSEDEDIEIPHICNIAAELKLKMSHYDEASKLCQRALRVASKAGLLPEQIDSHLLAGMISSKVGDYEEAYTSLRKGLTIARKLSDELDNESDQKTFQQRRRLVSLATEIKKLHRKLTPKKGQVK